MYEGYFGLAESPFGITPNTSFFFMCPSSQEALNTLVIAANNGEGFIKITGEVGTGKTLLCRKFMAMLDDSFVTAYIPNPLLEPRTLLLALADELEIELDPSVDQHQLLKSINHRLLVLAGDAKKVIVCIDEAQALPLDSLEALRLLTNLETEKRKLLQIVLFGQPELDKNLENKAIRQLAQRITFHAHLKPLTKDDLDFYLSHRLKIAGYQGGRLFKHGAVRALHLRSGGIPRLINILAHKSLMLAYGEGRGEITAEHVNLAAMDTIAAKRNGLLQWLMLSLLVLLIASAAVWVYWE